MIANWGKGRGRSRKREIGHGWVMGDETSQAAAGFMRRDLGGAISRRDLDGAISWRDLVGSSGVGEVVRWLVCSSSSLSLSLGVCESENHLKVKQKRKWFSGSKGLFYGQSLRFSRKLYFTCTPKHAAGCKIFSENYLHPKQTQP